MKTRQDTSVTLTEISSPNYIELILSFYFDLLISNSYSTDFLVKNKATVIYEGTFRQRKSIYLRSFYQKWISGRTEWHCNISPVDASNIPWEARKKY